MSRIKVLHQVLDPSGAGGVSAEFRALKNSTLSPKYDFNSMILVDFKPGLSIHNIRFYYKNIKRVKPDIVHIRGAAIDSLNAIIAARFAGHCKVLTTVHGLYSDMVYYNPIKKWISRHIIENLIFGLSHGISCVCKNATDRPYFDRFRKKMLPFVYNRMPRYDLTQRKIYRDQVRREYNISDDDVLCLFVGRMTKEKGLVTLERMFERYDNFPSKLVFMFVGDGDYKEEFESKCVSSDSRIVFTGLRKDVHRFYMAADLFLQPSLHENHSIALLEACAAGIPSIATDCGGNNETIRNHHTGIIIPVDDENAIYSAINKMLGPGILTEFTHNVLTDKYAQFSDAECDRSLDRVYMTILNNNER